MTNRRRYCRMYYGNDPLLQIIQYEDVNTTRTMVEFEGNESENCNIKT